MKTGVSTACLYPMETTDALDALLKNGVDCFEFFSNTFSEIQKDYYSSLISMINKYGASVRSIHPFTSGYEPYLIFSGYKKRYLETLEFYRYYFSCAADMGAKIVVLHGDRKTPKNGISDEEYFERFAACAKIGREYGVTLAQENVNAFRSQSPDFIVRMKEYLGSEAAFVFDIKQSVRAGCNPCDMCRAMGDRLVHVHLNDNNMYSDCLLPGQGNTDYKKIFDILKINGYSGDFIIEVYRSNFNELGELVDSYQCFKDLVADSFLLK